MINKYSSLELRTIKLNPTLFDEIILSSLSQIEYIYLSSNTTLNQEQIHCLFMLNIDGVNINLLRNRICPKERIEQFLHLNDKIYNITIAHNPTLDQSTINTLKKLDDPDVNMSLTLTFPE